MRITESRELNSLSTSVAVAASVSSVSSFLQAHGGFAQTEIQTTSAEVSHSGMFKLDMQMGLHYLYGDNHITRKNMTRTHIFVL